MKHIIRKTAVWVLIVLMAASVLPVAALAVQSGKCGPNVTWSMDDSGRMTIRGTGPVTESFAYDVRTTVKKLIVEEGVTALPNSAFFMSRNLVEVSLPESLTSVGEYAFNNSGLHTLTIPGSLRVLPAYSFSADLTSITIPATVISIDRTAIYNQKMTDVYYLGTRAQWETYGLNDNELSYYPTTTTVHCLGEPKHTVSFAKNGGSGSANPITVTEGDSYGILPTVTRPGYYFDGWYTSSTGGERVTRYDIVSIKKDHTLYAKWGTLALASVADKVPAATNNRGWNDYNGKNYINTKWTRSLEPSSAPGISRAVTSYLYANDRGGLTRVEYTKKAVIVEDYDDTFHLVRSLSFQPELNYWGGFYEGKDYLFLVYGEDNMDKRDDAEVLRVVRYDKGWNRIDSVSAYGDLNRSRESRQKNTKSLRSEALLQSKLDGAFVMQFAGGPEMVEVIDSVSKNILNGICA